MSRRVRRRHSDEFKREAVKLVTEQGVPKDNAVPPTRAVKATRPAAAIPEQKINVPLIRHKRGATRALANLDEELIVDVDQMSPEAAQYVRKRPCMTPDLMRHRGVGWIPGNGR